MFNKTTWGNQEKVFYKKLDQMALNDEETIWLAKINPQGILGCTMVTADVTVDTSPDLIASVTATVGRNRYIEVSFFATRLEKSAGTGRMAFDLYIDGVSDSRYSWVLPNIEDVNSQSASFSPSFSWTLTDLASGSHTFDLYANTNVGTLKVGGLSTTPITLWVEDMGALRNYE